MTRYAGQLLAPAERFSLWPSFVLPFGRTNSFYAAFPHSRPFLCTAITLKCLVVNIVSLPNIPFSTLSKNNNKKKVQKPNKKRNNPKYP